MKRFPLKQYASVELNQVAFPKTGLVVSQVPLGAEYTAAAPCENGMWVLADKANGVIKSVAAVTDTPIGIVYTSEKEYDIMHYGLNTFGRKIAGDMPRVGILSVGDTITSNCLQYDESEFEDDEDAEEHSAVLEALAGNLATAAGTLYVVPVAGSSVPKITATKPNAGAYGRVVKFYTMPNGEKGIKYQIVHI